MARAYVKLAFQVDADFRFGFLRQVHQDRLTVQRRYGHRASGDQQKRQERTSAPPVAYTRLS